MKVSDKDFPVANISMYMANSYISYNFMAKTLNLDLIWLIVSE